MKEKSIKGQMRVIEVILASWVIIFALTFVNMFAVTPTSPKYEVTELEKLGYNVLLDLDKQGLLTDFVYNEEWENLTAALKILLPMDIYFNMTVYHLNGTIVNKDPIFFGNRETFLTSSNIAAVTYGLCGYSTKNKAIYDPRILVLQLARG